MSKCISTFLVDHKFEHDRMLKSLLKFHPEVNVEVVQKEEVIARVKTYAYAVIELPLFEKYTTVTHIDNDVIILGRIDELFDDSTDVRAGRNNTDSGRCAIHGGLTLPEVDVFSYVNAGIHSVSSSSFMEEWDKVCSERCHEFPYGEQGVLNHLFHSGRYNSKILDPINSNEHWGSSFTEGTKTYWDLWKRIIIVGDHLELNGKIIRMMHIAGGTAVKPKLSDLLSPSVVDFIRNITG